MVLKPLEHGLTVCKVASVGDVDLTRDFYFIGRTNEEISLVCRTEDAPENAVAREDGWRAFRVEGVLDFSLIGILSKISGILAEAGVGLFAVSTYNTDYILVKEENFDRALDALAAKGMFIEGRAEERIETDRLILRPLRVEDAEDVFQWVGDPVVNRYMPYPVYETVEQAKKWIRSIRPGQHEFGFELKETGKVIGAGSVHLNPEENAYELGYNLNRAYWGRGYATEAARAMINWAHDVLGVHDFVASHATANAASGKVILKCGFSFVKYGQYGRYDGSEIFDASFYRLHMD